MQSMTGFARAEFSDGGCQGNIEIRTVNHRFLDCHFRLPDSLRSIEHSLRSRIQARLKRGKVDLTLNLNLASQQNVLVNEALVAQYVDLASPHLSVAKGVTLDMAGLFRLPGVVQAATIDVDRLQPLINQALDEALSKVVKARHTEGLATQDAIVALLVEMSPIVQSVLDASPEAIKAQESAILAKLKQIQATVPEERLAQELVFWAQKNDVQEELVRLTHHIQSAYDLVAATEPVGRSFDFLCQEMNREANTLAAKSHALLQTDAAMQLKVLIEQLREQVQNVE